ncbi:MAG TPA: Ig-like domain-containing protein, partial [Longimicrobium sp.]
MTRLAGRILSGSLLAGALVSCAHIEAPPGGAEDKEPPRLVATRPDTLARTRGFQGDVLFVFDEGLSEQGIDTLVSVSPRTSSPDVDKSGDELSVGLRGGWQPNRVYQVTIAPGLQDRFGNRTTEPIRLVFSTGPEIPATLAVGEVVDRTTTRPAAGARVEAVLLPDSLVYATRTDSAGRYAFEQVPEGDYRLRAYNDQNRSRTPDPFEASDTATLRVAARDTVQARRLSIVRPDTTPPAAGSARGEGDVIEVKFDDYLDPAQPLSPAQVTVTGPGGAVPVTAVRLGPFPEAGPPTTDSARADTARAGRPPAGRDTARARPPARDTVQAPSQSLFVRTGARLAPETTYRVRVTGVRNLVGLVGGGEVELKTPRPAPAPPPAPAAAP